MNVNAGVWMAMSPEARYKSLEIAQRITKERWKTKKAALATEAHEKS